MKIAVVILNWNGEKLLEQFLPSVVQYSPEASIYVADNASTDNSIAFLKSNFPTVQVIENKENSGFAGGYNQALNQVEADIYALVNSDIEVTKNWLKPILETFENEPNTAIIQPKILDFKNKEFFEYAGAAGGFIDKYGYPFCRGRIFDTCEKDENQYNKSGEIFWASGACLFINAKLFHEIGGFDADFFAHMEEIDLCWRLKNLGYKVMYCPDSTVYHVGGGTLNKTSPKKTYLNFRNNLILICKNHPPQYFFLKLMWRMNLDGVAGVKFLVSGQFSHFVAVLKAHKSFYFTLKSTLSKRKALKKNIKTYTTTAVYLHSIIADYYIRGKKTFTAIDLKNRFL